MPKKAKQMSAVEVKRLSCSIGKDGKPYNTYHAVGGVSGLLLQAAATGAKTWILRTKIGNKRRLIGLGGYPDVSLSEARRKASEMKDKIAQGIDPVEERKAAKLEMVRLQQRNVTFKEVATACYEVKAQEFKNDKHSSQWWRTLEVNAFPDIGDMSINEITTDDIVNMLKPKWLKTPDAADRVRQRVGSVFEYALTGDHPIRTNPVNPAQWKHLKGKLPAIKSVKKKAGTAGRHHPALPYDQVPRLMAELKKRNSNSARALRFALLTAARSNEIRGATWDEIDLKNKVWRLTAERMKADKPHTVPLCDDALALLKSLPKDTPGNLVFPSPRGKIMSDMTLSKYLKDLHHADVKKGGDGYADPNQDNRIATPHGVARSSFKEWARKATRYPDEWSELALAHINDDATRAAYARDELLAERREMMNEWDLFCRYGLATDSNQDKVTNIGEAR
ncbi:integrase arm-type DNA-binding domain-containing protein [Marinobacter nauticus]